MLNKSSIPPLTSHKSLNPKIPALAADKMVIDKAVQAWDVPIRVACVNSYGAAGSNAALLCAEAPPSNASHNRTTTQSATPDSISEIGFPIILSAANRNPQVEIGNLAFTLAERRKRHRFALTAAVKELKELRHVLENPTDIREVPAPGESKGIILAFSGQSKRWIGLDSSLYHASPRFQARIQDCEALLVEMGYPSIMADLFGTSPVSDVVVLQTGTFAVQYASALCWIDSGLKVDACIGHSFGELTALVVTGVLSLQDGLRLVATRACLMESAWGPERGTMLAIHGHKEMVHEVVDRVGTDMLEVACYNSSESQVIVGSAESIQQAEELLRSEPRYAQTKSQRLDVTHGFHSRFTEPLLNDLKGLSKSLHFSTTPRIHMETCTADPDIAFGPRYINQHTRSPVYFADAVHRLEARFGSCTWVEAGQATPIMAMIKRATDQRDSHKYYSLGQEGSTLLSLTTKLWNDGMDVSFWPFLTPAESGVQQISLPSYRFTKTTAWMENIDRANEAHELLAEANSSPGSYERDNTIQSAAPPVLVSLRERQDPKRATFTIHCDTERFGGIVKGHAVRNRALCPASMYMECATMAMQTLGTDLRGNTLCFEGVQFESPLGVNLTRHVTLTAVQDTKKPSSWKFAVSSSPKEDRSSKLTMHGKGSITLGTSPNLNAYQRLATERAQELESKSGTEKLMGKRAYGLFSQVVTYSEFLRGISSITMDGRQAVADIQLSSGHMGENDSSAIDLCDTVATDNFIQVVGLLINSGPHCPPGEVFVATGVDTAILSGAGGFLKSKSFKVYAMYTMISDTQSTGDIFIMRPDYTLVGVILGAAFTKLPINTLEKLLDAANKGSSAVKPKATVQDEQLRIFHHDESTGTVGLEKDWQGDSGYSSDGVATPQSDTDHQANRDKLTAIVCEYTGVTPDTLSEDDTMMQLGIDSLGSAEMASELQAQFGKELTSEELMEATLKSLTNLLIGSPMVPTSMLGKPGLPPSKSAAVVESKRPAAQENGKNEQKRAKIVAMVAEMAGADPSSVAEGITLSELGVDSLASVQLKGDLENAFDLEIDEDDFDLAMTVGDICRLANVTENNAVSIAGDTSNLVTPTTSAKGADLEPVTSRGNGITATPFQQEKINFACVGDPAMALKLSESDLPSWAAKCGYDSYWSVVSRKQDGIVVAYILEAYRQLGLDLSSLPAGKSVEGITYLPMHEKLMQRIWQILQKHGIIERTEQGSFIRTAKIWPSTPAQQLSASFLADFPRYQSEAQLMAVTGPKLAGCLAGKDNPVALLFSNATSQKALEAYYQTSPMLATATELLVDMITRSVSHADGSAPVRILEIGAGFGGTSRRLLEALETTGIQVEYTFTDIAPTLINRASKTFAHVRGMTFKTLDIEKAPPAALCGRYDIVLGTNCIHATSDRTRSIRHIKDLLHPGGYMVLSEVTEIVDWYDIVYGLLEGWWLAKEGIYPLQPPESWVQCFRDAGFARENVMVSDGPSRDLRTQRLLLASRKALAGNAPPRALQVQPLRKTVVYKEAYGVPIHADIYLPRDVTTQAMPVALVVHGGGHMTLSRTAIRPTQVEFLLANGILPVSLDYRLCPEVNLIDGPMTDVRDAYLWAQRSLKSVVSQWDIAVDDTKIAVGAVPPSAVLSFYGPTDFESGALDARRAEEYPERKMSLKEIMRKLPRKPITRYDNGKLDSTGLGWVKPGDPRSELVLSLFKEGNGLPLMLNGLPPAGDVVDDRNAFGNAEDVDPAKVASISPLAQVTSGGYGAVPTFLVHGTEDELVPYESARTFVDALRRAGVDCGLLTVPGARHIHDMDIKPGTTKWEKEVAPAYEFLMKRLMH
ncbi:6-methylsalicylic acid synthase [Apiospora arundinis]